MHAGGSEGMALRRRFGSATIHGCEAFLVVVGDAVDPGAHGIARKVIEAGSL